MYTNIVLILAGRLNCYSAGRTPACFVRKQYRSRIVCTEIGGSPFKCIDDMSRCLDAKDCINGQCTCPLLHITPYLTRSQSSSRVYAALPHPGMKTISPNSLYQHSTGSLQAIFRPCAPLPLDPLGQSEWDGWACSLFLQINVKYVCILSFLCSYCRLLCRHYAIQTLAGSELDAVSTITQFV